MWAKIKKISFIAVALVSVLLGTALMLVWSIPSTIVSCVSWVWNLIHSTVSVIGAACGAPVMWGVNLYYKALKEM